jgi:tetratricopeptide (TPR) repeat protein
MNPFEVLQIGPAASRDEAKEAYHRLAKKWHPDKFSGPEKTVAEDKFMEIAEAYAKIKSGEAAVHLPNPQPQPPLASAPAQGAAAQVLKAPKDWLSEAKNGFEQKNYELALSLSHFCFQFPEVAERARLVYAMSLEAAGKDTKSRTRAYEEVIRINPNNKEAVTKLAELYLALNMPTRAESMALKAKALGTPLPSSAAIPKKQRGNTSPQEGGGIMGKLTAIFKRG